MIELAANRITREELNAIEKLIPSPTIVFNGQLVLAMNSSFLNLMGYERQEFTLDILKKSIHRDYKDKFQTFITEYLVTGKTLFENEILILDKYGRELWIDYTHTLVVFENEYFIVAHLNDITELKTTQKRLEKLLNIEEAMLKITQSIIGKDALHAIYDTILDTAIKYVDNAVVGTIMLKGNHSDGNMMLVAQKGFEDDAIGEFKLPIDQSFLYMETKGKMDRIIKIDNIFELEKVHKIPVKEGSEDYIHSTISAPIYIEEEFFGQVNVDGLTENCFTEADVKIIEFIRNNIEIAINNHRLYEEKMFLSRYDSLTKLYNRTYFENLFDYTLERAARYNEGFNLVLFDINGLKFVNDNFGHLAGDQLIKNVANSWKQFIRKSDILARYGGDEFIGIFFHTTPEELNEKFNNLLSDFASESMDIGPSEIKGSFAFGVATYGIDGTSSIELVKKADERMYQNKIDFKMKFPII